MAKATASRHLLLLLAVIVITAAGLAIGGMMANPVYANELQSGKIVFDRDSEYDWAHFYNVDNRDVELSMEDLNITVQNEAGKDIESDSYDLTIEHVYYSEEAGREVGGPVDLPIGIWESDKGEGFTQYRAIARDKEDPDIFCEGNFVIMDRHSLNFFCADISFDRGTATWYEGWRMHDRYWFNPGTDINCIVKHVGDSEPLREGDDYEINYYRVARPEDMDREDEPIENILVADERYKVVDDEGDPTKPTEPGSYFARIKGRNNYYGENDVLVEIDSIPRIVFRSDGEHELWSDDTLTYSVQRPEGVEGVIQVEGGVRDGEGRELNLGKEYFQYDPNKGELTVDGSRIFEACRNSEIRSDQLDIRAWIDEGQGVLAEGYTKADLREAKYEYDLPDNDDLLPGWDGWIDRGFHVYIENKQYPEGKDWDLEITSAEITSDPAEAITLEQRNGGWEYRANALGKATITLGYYDIDGTTPRVHSFEVTASDHVYWADFWPVKGVNKGLPGTSIELQADAEHNYIRYDEDDHDNWWHDSTREGLVYHWDIVRGDEFATITPNANDPTKATLTFNALAEGDENIGEQIIVKLSITDTESDDSNRERASNEKDFWVNSDYTQIMPAMIDSKLDVGKSMTIDPELWHYQLGKEGHEVIKGVYFEIEEYDPDAIDVDKTDKGITITRKGDWDTNFKIKARFRWEGSTRYEWEEHWYHLDRREYRIEFPYDNIEIYSDQELTIELMKEELEGLEDELEDEDNFDYRIEYKVGTWDPDEEGWTYEMGSDMYCAGPDGITFNGMDLKQQALERNTNGFNVHAKLFIKDPHHPHQPVSDTWIWVELNDRPCKDGNHKWLKATIQEATCQDNGREIWACLQHQTWDGCGEVRIVETDPLGHDIVKVAFKDSTLTATGNYEHFKCNRCKKLFDDPAGTKERPSDSVVIPKKINISGATIAKIANKTYNKKAQKPALTVKYGTKTLKSGTDYTAAYSNNTNAGTAKVTITGKGLYAGTKTTTFVIVKAANTMTLKPKAVTVKAASVAKANQTVKQATACTVTSPQGKVTWKKASGNASITVASNGNITVKKGLRKGTYKVGVKATAAGNTNYKAITKSATITIYVK